MNNQDGAKAPQNNREKYLSLEVPKGGYQIDLGDDFVYTLKPLNRNVLTTARQMIGAGKPTEAAVALVDTLRVDGSPKASDIGDEDIDVLLGLEDAIGELLQARKATIKKK